MNHRSSSAPRRRLARLVVIGVTAVLATLVTAVPAHAADYRVTGRVTTTDGKPASGVEVFFFENGVVPESGPVPRAKTGADGRYATRILKGTYKVGFEKPSSNEYEIADAQGYWPSGVTLDEGEDLVLTGARTVDGVVERAGRINGTLKGADGTVPGKLGIVTFYRQSADGTWRIHDEVRTGSLGAYSLKVPTGRYVVQHEAPGLAAEFSGDAATFADAEQIEIGEGTTRAVQATLEAGGTLEGQLVAPRGFRQAEVKVTAFQEGPTGWKATRYATYDQSAEWYSVKGLNTGPYRICWTLADTVDRHRFLPECIGGRTVATASDVDATAGQVRYPARATLREATVVRGTVTDPDGSPVEGVSVCPVGAEESCRDGTAGDTTDAEGGYSFQVIPTGSAFKLRLVPSLLRGVTQTFNAGAASASQAPSIAAAPNKTLTQDVTLRSDGTPDVTITGTIRDGAGRGLVETEVAVKRVGADPADVGSVQGAPDGSYRLVLEPGDYEVTHSADGYKPSTSQVTVTADAERDAVLAVNTGKGTVRGQLTRDGAPLAGVRVHVTGRKDSSPVEAEATTTANGIYVIRGLSPFMSYVVRYVDPVTGKRLYIERLSVRSGTTTPVDPFDVPAPAAVESRPVIAAAPRVGQPVRVTPATWSPADVTLTYAWFAGSTKVASTLAYTPKAADVGKPLRLKVIAKRGTAETTTNTFARVAQG